jgi:hypothetical protein
MEHNPLYVLTFRRAAAQSLEQIRICPDFKTAAVKITGTLCNSNRKIADGSKSNRRESLAAPVLSDMETIDQTYTPTA